MQECPNLFNILMVALPVSMECSIQLSRSSRAEDMNYVCLVGTDPAFSGFIEQPGIVERLGLIIERSFLPRVSHICHQKLQQTHNTLSETRNLSVLWSHLAFQLSFFPTVDSSKGG